MECPEFRLLNDWIDGTVDGQPRAVSILLHIQRCKGCRTTEAWLRDVRRLFGSTSWTEPSQAWRPRLRAAFRRWFDDRGIPPESESLSPSLSEIDVGELAGVRRRGDGERWFEFTLDDGRLLLHVVPGCALEPGRIVGRFESATIPGTLWTGDVFCTPENETERTTRLEDGEFILHDVPLGLCIRLRFKGPPHVTAVAIEFRV